MSILSKAGDVIGDAVGSITNAFTGRGNRMSDAGAAAISDKLLGGDTKLTDEQKSVLTDAKLMKKGGMTSSASRRADGMASRGKTRGKMV